MTTVGELSLGLPILRFYVTVPGHFFKISSSSAYRLPNFKLPSFKFTTYNGAVTPRTEICSSSCSYCILYYVIADFAATAAGPVMEHEFSMVMWYRQCTYKFLRHRKCELSSGECRNWPNWVTFKFGTATAVCRKCNPFAQFFPRSKGQVVSS